MSFPRKSYRLTSDAEKSRVTGKGWQGGVCVCVCALCIGEGEGRENAARAQVPRNLGLLIHLVPVTGSLPAPMLPVWLLC